MNIEVFYNDLVNNYSDAEIALLAKHTFGSKRFLEAALPRLRSKSAQKVRSDQLIQALAREHAARAMSKNVRKGTMRSMHPIVETYFNMSKTQLLKMAIQQDCSPLIKFILDNYQQELSSSIIKQARDVLGSKAQNPVQTVVQQSSAPAIREQQPSRGCVLTRRCPQGYKLGELEAIARECGIDIKGMTKNDICVAIKKVTEPQQAGKLYDVGAQGVTLAQEFISKQTGEPIINPTGWLASEKFDGVRAIWDGQDFVSRSATVYAAPKWFKEMMPAGVVLDGELFIGRDKFQETVSVVRKKIPVDREWERIKYQVFDLPLSRAGAEDRITEYTRLVQELCSKFRPTAHIRECPIKATRQVRITSMADLTQQYQNIIAAGGEGMMLRKPKSKYIGKRTRDLLKYKPTFDAEAVIIGYETGTGKNTGILGAFIVRDQRSGAEFKVGSGLSDELRVNYLQTHPIGTIITYLYTGLTNAGIPRHPRYLRKRID